MRTKFRQWRRSQTSLAHHEREHRQPDTPDRAINKSPTNPKRQQKQFRPTCSTIVSTRWALSSAHAKCTPCIGPVSAASMLQLNTRFPTVVRRSVAHAQEGRSASKMDEKRVPSARATICCAGPMRSCEEVGDRLRKIDELYNRRFICSSPSVPVLSKLDDWPQARLHLAYWRIPAHAKETAQPPSFCLS